MVASIWLQLGEKEQQPLRNLIAALAVEHATMPFEPHLTVCTIAEPTPEKENAAADYIGNSRVLPLEVRKATISISTVVPFRAVVIDVENSPTLQEFREKLRDLTGANKLVLPHISLLYTIDAHERRTSWSSDGKRLRAIAAKCEAWLSATQFLLERPVLVAPDGDWTRINSWKTVRRF